MLAFEASLLFLLCTCLLVIDGVKVTGYRTKQKIMQPEIPYRLLSDLGKLFSLKRIFTKELVKRQN